MGERRFMQMTPEDGNGCESKRGSLAQRTSGHARKDDSTQTDRGERVMKKYSEGRIFLLHGGDEPCILRMRTHFTQRASEHRLGGRE